MIYFLPIEPMHERYSEQMLRWVEAKLPSGGYTTLLPERRPVKIVHGQWLDTFGTCEFKSSQLQMVARLFAEGAVRDGDVFLLGDVWMPGVEQIRFMAEMAGLRVKIAGWHYAGMFDPQDLLHRTLTRWASGWERNLLLNVLDAVCVGSEFHKALILKAFKGRERDGVDVKILPAGLAWDRSEVAAFAVPVSQREKIVCFPHRIAPEKGVDCFVRLAHRLASNFPDWRWCISTSSKTVELPPEIAASNVVELVRHESKADYYRWLARCGVWYSAATQETFGYSMHEAAALGLPIVAPRRCSYAEMLTGPGTLYKSAVGEVEMIGRMMAFDRGIVVPAEVRSDYSRSITGFLDFIWEQPEPKLRSDL